MANQRVARNVVDLQKRKRTNAVADYRRNRPLTTISTSPRVLLALQNMGKNKSGRLGRSYLRYANLVEQTAAAVKRDFRTTELQALAERLYAKHGWHDRVAETVVTPEDFLRMLKIDEGDSLVQRTIFTVKQYVSEKEGIKVMALIEEIERRIAEIRDEEREKKAIKTAAFKAPKRDVESVSPHHTKSSEHETARRKRSDSHQAQQVQ